jgi:hypothetical protein
MANHTIDCEFCGQDRRLIAGYCCEEYEKQEKSKEAAIKARDDENARYLKKFGLDPRMNSIGYFTVLDADDVVDAFKRLEAKHARRLKRMSP